MKRPYPFYPSLSALRTPSQEERDLRGLAWRRGRDAASSVRWRDPDAAYEEARSAARFGSVVLDLKALRLKLYREAQRRLRGHGGFRVPLAYRDLRPY